MLVPDGETLRAPTPVAVATALGLRTRAERALYDLCIVGGGPAGLAAAVYAASEGLSTVVVEHDAPGGQAGQSAAIENYLGFPRGLSGADLAQRAIAQARRFGAEMVLARDVVALEARGPVRAVRLDGAGDIEARSVVLATGVSYRRLEAPGLDALSAAASTTARTPARPRPAPGTRSTSSGAANSAGQAVLNLARYASRVTLVVRGEALEASMSQYLVERIRADERIRVLCRTEVVGGRRGRPPRAADPLRPRTGATTEVDAAGSSSTSAPRRAPTGSAPTSCATTTASS